MGKSIVFMFPGQGSQYYQMGKELFERHAVFRRWMLTLDDIAREIIGESVLRHVYDEKRQRSEPFDRIIYSHPAIFMVEYSLARVLLEKGIEPEYVLGASMGEFASAALADVVSVDELFGILLKQAEAFEVHCEKGGMLAIIHDKKLFNDVPQIRDNSELVAVNFDSHFVISGNNKQLHEIERYLKNHNILFQPLPVTYGFHSSYIDPAEPAVKDELQHLSLHPPRISYISCLHGAVLEQIPLDHFWDVVRMPMQFPRAIEGLESGCDRIYLDVGPGGTLANFTKRNLSTDSKSAAYSIMTPFDQELKNLTKIEGLFAATTN
jgi:trans-AT polyketide synthase, acyltransferase and oxidoreductase domains